MYTYLIDNLIITWKWIAWSINKIQQNTRTSLTTKLIAFCRNLFQLKIVFCAMYPPFDDDDADDDDNHFL